MIPKVIHVAWPNTSVLDDNNPIIKNGIRRLHDLNPDWKLTVYDDQAIQQDLMDFFPPHLHELVDKIEPFVSKVDLWRLVKVYNNGGLYLDIDRLCDQQLDQIINEKTICVMPTNQDWDVSQDFLMSAPDNTIYAKAIELIIERRGYGETDTYFLGPQTYMHAVTEMLAGVHAAVNPGREWMDWIRHRFNSLPWLVTYSESPPFDTVLYRAKTASFDFEQAKKDLYIAHNIKHWLDQC